MRRANLPLSDTVTEFIRDLFAIVAGSGMLLAPTGKVLAGCPDCRTMRGEYLTSVRNVNCNPGGNGLLPN